MTKTTHENSVAIIILNWNRKDDTIDCLKSLKKVQYQNYKIIVVDNASTDGSSEEIKEKFYDVHLINNSENLGFPEGNNIGIRWAIDRDFDYVLLLNNDTTVAPDFLYRMMIIGEQNSDIGILGPTIVYHSNLNKVWSKGGFISKSTGRPFHYYENKAPNQSASYVDWVSGCALLIKASVIRQVGLLDTDYYFGTEDVDWCIRAKKAGCKIVIVERAIVMHKKEEFRLLGKHSNLDHYYSIRNLLIFISKHGGFNIAFFFSFINTCVKRMIWSMLSFDFRSLQAIWLAIFDFCRKKYGKAKYVF